MTFTFTEVNGTPIEDVLAGIEEREGDASEYETFTMDVSSNGKTMTGKDGAGTTYTFTKAD